MTRRARALGVLVALGLLLGARPGVAQDGREVRIGVPSLEGVLAPGAAARGAGPLAQRLVLDTLVAYREHSTDVEPALATAWTVSRDGLLWSFTLRDGVRFHDGTPLTAAAAVASFEAHLRPGAGEGRVWSALMRGTPGVVREFRAAGARTLEIALVQPYAPLLTALAHPGLGITRVTVDVAGTERLVGTGPYRVAEATRERLVLQAAPGHWSGRARAERLVFLEADGDERAEAELDAGRLDVWMAAQTPRRLRGAVSIPGPGLGYLALHAQKGRPLADLRVRQAVAAALEPATLGPLLAPAAVPLVRFLPAGYWAQAAPGPPYGGSPQEVVRLLRGAPGAARQRLVCLVAVGPGTLDTAQLGETLVRRLDAMGLTVELRLEPPEVAATLTDAGAFDLALVEADAIGADPHHVLYPLSSTEGITARPRPLNLAFAGAPRLDELLGRASQLSWRPERLRLYQRVQHALAAELLWLPLYQRLLWVVTAPGVDGLALHPTGLHRVEGVTVRRR